MATFPLYDKWGMPVEVARLTEEEAAPTLGGVRSPMSDHPADGLTPQRLGRLLRAAEDGDATAYLELAEQMEEKDLHYRAVLSTRRNQVAGLEITVEAASDKPDDVADADLVREVFWRETIQMELFDMLDAVGKGFSVMEILWNSNDNGRWMPRDLKWRDPRWFGFDRSDGETLMLRDDSGQLVPLKAYGFVRHVSKTKSGLPIRGGLARAVAWFYLFKNFDIRSWVQFSEAYGKPLRIGKYHAGATEAEKQTLLRAVRNIWADAAAIIPESMTIDLIEAKITGNVDLFERFADWIDRQISKAVLGQTGTTDTGSRVGTADAHEKVRDDIELADAVQLAATLTRDLAVPIVELNRGKRVRYPRIRLNRPDQEDIGKLVDNVTKLVPFGLRVERTWMADKLGVPDPDKGAEILAAPARPAIVPAGIDTTAETTSAQAAQLPGAPAANDSVEKISAQLAGTVSPAMDKMIDRVKELVNDPSISSIEDLSARLLDAYPGMNPNEIAAEIANALIAANLAGIDEVTEDPVTDNG